MKISHEEDGMTDLEFKSLISLKKVFNKNMIELPSNGKYQVYNLERIESRDKFFLDIDRRGRIEFSKFKLQSRYAVTKLPLVRIDIDSPPHMNPDGTKTSRNHIHIYKETENDTGNLPWAYDLETFNQIKFTRINFMEIFKEFCKYCNIIIGNVQDVI